MPKFHFTQASVTRFLTEQSTASNRVTAYDRDVAGLGVYANTGGSGTYFLHYRISGKQKKHTLGRVGQLPISDLRAKANALLLAGRDGIDPIAQRKIALADRLTIGEAYADYMVALGKRRCSSATMRTFASLWKAMIADYADREIKSVKKREVRDWHSRWEAKGPSAANHAAKLLRSIINHAHKLSDDLPPNPCIAIEFFREQEKRPILAWENLPVWCRLVEGLPNPVRRSYWRFILFTGLRAADGASVRWADLNGAILHRPMPKGGPKKAFDLPLSWQALEAIEEARCAGAILFPKSPYVFPAESLSGHIANFREDTFTLTPHVLRRVYATACIEAGIDPYTTKLLLNHSADNRDVTARYIKPSSSFIETAAQTVSDYIKARTI